MAGETNSGIYKIDGIRIIAASAQRAEADGNGDVISTTYLKKADSSATEWNSVYDTVEANSGNWDDVSAKLDSSAFTAFTATADVTPYTAGDNINITNHVISGYDWTEEIAVAAENAEDAAVEDVDKNFDQSPDGITGYNGSAFAGTKYTAGDGIDIDSSNVISVTGDFVTSATAATAQDKLLVLHNNNWVELPDTEGGYLTAGAAGADNHPDVVTGTSALKYIYLVKDSTVTGDDKYNEWIFTSADASTTAWEKIGDTSVPLSDYVPTAATANWDVDSYSAANEYVNVTNHQISGYDWTTTIQAASANAVTTALEQVESKFETDTTGLITGYDGTAFATPSMSADEWNSVYNTVQSNSANWKDEYTIITVPNLTEVEDLAP